jgi:hypothetical protein
MMPRLLCIFFMLDEDVVASKGNWCVGFANTVVGVAIIHVVFDLRQDNSRRRQAQDLFPSGWKVLAEVTGEHYSVHDGQLSPHGLLLPAHNVLGDRLAGVIRQSRGGGVQSE